MLLAQGVHARGVRCGPNATSKRRFSHASAADRCHCDSTNIFQGTGETATRTALPSIRCYHEASVRACELMCSCQPWRWCRHVFRPLQWMSQMTHVSMQHAAASSSFRNNSFETSSAAKPRHTPTQKHCASVGFSDTRQRLHGRIAPAATTVLPESTGPDGTHHYALLRSCLPHMPATSTTLSHSAAAQASGCVDDRG